MAQRLALELQQKLHDRGLRIDFYPPQHRRLPNVALIRKPTHVAGNSVPYLAAPLICQFGVAPEEIPEIESNAPALYLGYCAEKDSWFVWCMEYGSADGFSDFQNYHATAEQAIDDVLDYFFGTAPRMETLQKYLSYLYEDFQTGGLLPANQVDRLLRHGLFLRPMSFNEIVWMRKYRGFAGDFIKGFEDSHSSDGGPDYDTPTIYLQRSPGGEDCWRVNAVNHWGVPGPGDFNSLWSTPEDAVSDILDFYCGTNDRMKAYANYWGFSMGRWGDWDGTPPDVFAASNLGEIDEAIRPPRQQDLEVPPQLCADSIRRLESHGLHVAQQPWFADDPQNRGRFGLIATIEKPDMQAGNYIAGYLRYADTGPSYTPSLKVHSSVCRNGMWEVSFLQYSGDPGQLDFSRISPPIGPGDFTRMFSTESEVVDDILDYYFGESNRMHEYARRLGCVAARHD